MTFMIALVGEQPLPNFLPVQHYHPSDVLLVYSARTKGMFEKLEAILQKTVKVHGLETDAYDISSIVGILNEKLDEVAESDSQQLKFNLTGGTKAMSFAAYQVAQQRKAPMMYLQSEKKDTRVYNYSWEDQQLHSAGTELLPECITLQDIFDLYLGENKWKEEGSSRSEGGPFEDVLADILRNNGYEVMVGVKAQNSQVDIDIVARYGNQYGIIEAKTGNVGKELKGIQQLSTSARLIGTYSNLFYAITISPNTLHEAIMKASNIKVISLLSFEKGKSLSSEDENEFLSKIQEALKG